VTGDILARANRGVVAQFAWSNVLVAFDYDGTLAPIVDDPAEARMRPRTRELLERVTARFRCAVISGRAQADLLRRLRGVGVFEAIGNHGLEPWRRTEDFAARVQAWLPVLRGGLDALKGVTIEDKLFSLAVHYRQSRSKKAARAAILRSASRLDGVRVVGGKQVINLLPEGAPHKGIALAAARDRLGCDTAIYVGDDETDEDVFALDEPGRLLTVRVGELPSSRAAFYIRAQDDIDDFLGLLASLREGVPRREQAAPRTERR
jgi:trehalose 6-phosphate phosphatase